MKKIFLIGIISLVSIFMFTGCGEMPEKGIYKEGTYFGYSSKLEGTLTYTTTAVIYINEYGMIKSLFIDSTYSDTPGLFTTKKYESYSYEISSPSTTESDIITIPDWNKQVKLIENAVLKEQGINFIKWIDDNKTVSESIDGVTMPINDIYTAINNALNEAK